MPPPRRGPVIIDTDETPLPQPEADREIDLPEPVIAPPSGERALRRAATRRRLSLAGRLFWGSLVGLILLGLGVWAGEALAGLFALAGPLGWIGTLLFIGLGAGLLIFALGEVAGLARMRRIDGLRGKAERLAAGGRTAEARDLAAQLDQLYAGRDDLAPAGAAMAQTLREATDAEEVLREAERHWMTPLDAAAEARVRRAAREVAAATAIIPLPLVDVAAVLWSNLRLIRGVAEIYGGRAGWLGSWRLLKAVAGHLVATGAVAATDELIGPLVGGGVLAKLSRRFGEAAVNAALTARVGVAAIEVCRPLPFAVRPAPRAGAIVMGALRNWRKREAEPTTDPARETVGQNRN